MDETVAAANEAFLSIDIETAGPYPARYALLSVGACTIDDPDNGLYLTLKPDKSAVVPSAMHLNQLSMDLLSTDGADPRSAMQTLARWIRKAAPPGTHPVMVAFNAPQDWPFINHYFYEYLGENPLGTNAIDIKAFYMGLMGCPWEETSMM